MRIEKVLAEHTHAPARSIETERDLIAPLNAAVLRELFSSLLGAQWRIRLEHSWARRKFAPQT